MLGNQIYNNKQSDCLTGGWFIQGLCHLSNYMFRKVASGTTQLNASRLKIFDFSTN